ncbi:hypothetical protein [Jiella pelagia]|uniref:Uncharacterized protein n=1 Tax=Jiella pelagia TaxID=2986949 RepID=A0ABY7BZM1_9HYPH|nr:hypothetical protein [Jiella pelagia]WAP69024.1 hypothetical protein OH818_01420 [Jiella pelagia]
MAFRRTLTAAAFLMGTAASSAHAQTAEETVAFLVFGLSGETAFAAFNGETATAIPETWRKTGPSLWELEVPEYVFSEPGAVIQNFRHVSQSLLVEQTSDCVFKTSVLSSYMHDKKKHIRVSGSITLDFSKAVRIAPITMGGDGGAEDRVSGPVSAEPGAVCTAFEIKENNELIESSEECNEGVNGRPDNAVPVSLGSIKSVPFVVGWGSADRGIEATRLERAQKYFEEKFCRMRAF